MRRALAAARLPVAVAVSLAFVGPAGMRSLNAAHRGLDRLTDVLSFGAALPPGVRGAAVVPHLDRLPDGTVELGDVVVSPERAARQARRRRWTVAEEVAFLAAHGTLHLLGYQDDTAAGYREMRRMGEELLDGARMLVGRAGGLKPSPRVRVSGVDRDATRRRHARPRRARPAGAARRRAR